jgi:hypothetical protein
MSSIDNEQRRSKVVAEEENSNDLYKQNEEYVHSVDCCHNADSSDVNSHS